MIAAGMAAPKWGADLLVCHRSVVRTGSPTRYLWHWPILIIAADEAGKTSLPFSQNIVWLLLALGLSLRPTDSSRTRFAISASAQRKASHWVLAPSS